MAGLEKPGGYVPLGFYEADDDLAIDIEGYFADSRFDVFRITGAGIANMNASSTQGHLYCRMKLNGAYQTAGYNQYSNGVSLVANGAEGLLASNIANNGTYSHYKSGFVMDVFRPNDADQWPTVHVRATRANGDVSGFLTCQAIYPLEGLRFFSAVNLKSGGFEIGGYRKR